VCTCADFHCCGMSLIYLISLNFMTQSMTLIFSKVATVPSIIRTALRYIFMLWEVWEVQVTLFIISHIFVLHTCFTDPCFCLLKWHVVPILNGSYFDYSPFTHLLYKPPFLFAGSGMWCPCGKDVILTIILFEWLWRSVNVCGMDSQLLALGRIEIEMQQLSIWNI